MFYWWLVSIVYNQDTDWLLVAALLYLGLGLFAAIVGIADILRTRRAL